MLKAVCPGLHILCCQMHACVHERALSVGVLCRQATVEPLPTDLLSLLASAQSLPAEAPAGANELLSGAPEASLLALPGGNTPPRPAHYTIQLAMGAYWAALKGMRHRRS